jgi:hypothetical protein
MAVINIAALGLLELGIGGVDIWTGISAPHGRLLLIHLLCTAVSKTVPDLENNVAGHFDANVLLLFCRNCYDGGRVYQPINEDVSFYSCHFDDILSHL